MLEAYRIRGRMHGLMIGGLVGVVGLMACVDGDFVTEANPVSSVSLIAETAEVPIGDSIQMGAQAVDATGAVVEGVSYSWASSDTTVARVNKKGKVIGRGKGRATITADADGVEGDTTITVGSAPVVAAVVVQPAADTLAGLGDSGALSATAYDSAGAPVDSATFAWISTDPGVVEVDAAGGIVARGFGTALVVASASGAADTASVTVLGTVSSSGAYFVSTAGDDAGPGTEAAPWRTLAYALTRLGPGETLYVRGGTYDEDIRNPSIQQGRADARITVAAYPGERPVLQGLLWLEGPSYWTIDGLNVTWSTDHGATDHMVQMKNGVGWIYENAEIWGARSFSGLLVYGSKAGEPSDWVVRGNCIHDVWTEPTHHINGDHNLYVNTGTSAGPGLIERNLFFNAPNGQNVKLGYGRSDPQPGDGTANVTVRYNTMVGSLKNVMLADETHGITLERNLIGVSDEGYGIRAYRLTGTNNVFRDNVFWGMTRFQYGDSGYGLVTDGGGNILPLDPQLDAVACGRMRPTDASASAYGRYAP
jgi:hypothetical protein